MKAPLFYYNLNKKEKELELNFMIAAILKSRMKLGFDKDEYALDEDVNIYLANLLLAYAQHGYRNNARRFISDVDIDVYEIAEASGNNVKKYFVYKMNADDLLVSLGIFRNLLSGNHYLGRAKIYYELACAYNFRIYRKSTATALVLDKLSRDMEKYVGILANLRGDYFSLVEKLSQGEFSNFCAEMKVYEDKVMLGNKQDVFLDMYSRWLKSKDAQLETRICELAKKLQIVDSTFSFNMPA